MYVYIIHINICKCVYILTAGRSISISTTSPSMISVSSLIRTPIERRNACVGPGEWVGAYTLELPPHCYLLMQAKPPHLANQSLQIVTHEQTRNK